MGAIRTNVSSFLRNGTQRFNPRPPITPSATRGLCSTVLANIAEDEYQQRLMGIFLLKTDYSGELENILECQNERKAQSADLFITYFMRAQKKRAPGQ